MKPEALDQKPLEGQLILGLMMLGAKPGSKTATTVTKSAKSLKPSPASSERANSYAKKGDRIVINIASKKSQPKHPRAF